MVVSYMCKIKIISTNSMYAVGNLTAWEKTVRKLPGPSVETLQVPPKTQICRKFAYASKIFTQIIRSMQTRNPYVVALKSVVVVVSEAPVL